MGHDTVDRVADRRRLRGCFRGALVLGGAAHADRPAEHRGQRSQPSHRLPPPSGADPRRSGGSRRAVPQREHLPSGGGQLQPRAAPAVGLHPGPHHGVPQSAGGAGARPHGRGIPRRVTRREQYVYNALRAQTRGER